MGKKNKGTLGLDRQELKKIAIGLGKTEQQVNKASTKTLENIAKNGGWKSVDIYTSNSNKSGYEIPTLEPAKTRKGKNTDFQLGVERTDLKRLATDLGFKGDVNKASTKALEQFTKNKLVGYGKDVTLTEPMKKDIKAFFQLGYSKGKGYLAEKLAKVAGTSYSGTNALAIEIEKQFSVYYDGVITKEMIDELMNVRMQYKYIGEAFNGLKNTFAYNDVFEKYAKEIEDKESKKESNKDNEL